MEKPEKPDIRVCGSIGTHVSWASDLVITESGDYILVCEIEEAELLQFALGEWIEYKRQLKKWDLAQRERENSE